MNMIKFLKLKTMKTMKTMKNNLVNNLYGNRKIIQSIQ